MVVAKGTSVLLQLVIWHPSQIIGDKSLGIAYVANNFGVFIGCFFPRR